MTEEKKDPWLNYLALATVILAVCATLSTFKGGSYSTRSVLSQTQASDQWAFYQSKSVKGYLYELQRDKLALELGAHRQGFRQAVLDAYEKKIASYEGKIGEYEAERASIQKSAKKFEEIRDDAQKHASAFGIAVIFLQISILLSSIAALIKKKYIWYIGLGVGAWGIVAFLNGFFLFL